MQKEIGTPWHSIALMSSIEMLNLSKVISVIGRIAKTKNFCGDFSASLGTDEFSRVCIRRSADSDLTFLHRYKPSGSGERIGDCPIDSRVYVESASALGKVARIIEGCGFKPSGTWLTQLDVARQDSRAAERHLELSKGGLSGMEIVMQSLERVQKFELKRNAVIKKDDVRFSKVTSRRKKCIELLSMLPADVLMWRVEVVKKYQKEAK